MGQHGGDFPTRDPMEGYKRSCEGRREKTTTLPGGDTNPFGGGDPEKKMGRHQKTTLAKQKKARKPEKTLPAVRSLSAFEVRASYRKVRKNNTNRKMIYILV